MYRVRWQQALPRWARAASFALGLLSAGAAILKPSNLTLPGAMVGCALVLLGWKGIPLIASAPSAAQGRVARIREGLRILRQRRRLAVAVALICPLLTAGLVPVISPALVPIAFFLSAIPVLVCLSLFFLSACPQCDQHFFVSRHLISAQTRCQHCKIPIRWVRPGDSA